jgi:hypothetical protein
VHVTAISAIFVLVKQLSVFDLLQVYDTSVNAAVSRSEKVIWAGICICTLTLWSACVAVPLTNDLIYLAIALLSICVLSFGFWVFACYTAWRVRAINFFSLNLSLFLISIFLHPPG